MDHFGIFSFFPLGLLGGYGHCAGMCNPFVLYVASRFTPSESVSAMRLFRPHLLYNFGRIITYTFLGLFFGTLGKISADLTKLQGAAAIAAGLFLFLYGSFGLFGISLAKKLESLVLVKAIFNSLSTLQPGNPFWVGLLLGFLPCGLVYSALAGALALSSPLAGGLAMTFFGLGTTVAMMTLALFGNYLIAKRGLWHKLSMLFLAVMGLYFILRAL
jgi:hypothetical protein